MDRLFGLGDKDAQALTKEIEAATNQSSEISGAERIAGATGEDANRDEQIKSIQGKIGHFATSSAIGMAEVEMATQSLETQDSVVGNTGTGAEGVDGLNEAEIIKSNQELLDQLHTKSGNEEQIKARLEQQAKDRQNEDNPNGSSGAKIVAKSQEEHAKEAEQEVEKILKSGNYEVTILVKLYLILQEQALRDLETPHPVGAGN